MILIAYDLQNANSADYAAIDSYLEKTYAGVKVLNTTWLLSTNDRLPVVEDLERRLGDTCKIVAVTISNPAISLSDHISDDVDDWLASRSWFLRNV